MTGERPQYRPGDVVNGHILGADGNWVPIAQPGESAAPPQWGFAGPPAQQAAYPYEQLPAGFQQASGAAPAQSYRPGDVVNGYVLNDRYQWEPVSAEETNTSKQRPPGALAVGAGVLAMVPFLGWVFGILAVIMGGRIVNGPRDSNREFVLGVIAVVLGVVGVVWQIRVY